MALRIFVWEVTPPQGHDVGELVAAMTPVGAAVQRRNPTVLEVAVVPHDDAVRVAVRYRGRDEWKVKTMALYALGPILVKCGVSPKKAKLVNVVYPPRGRQPAPPLWQNIQEAALAAPTVRSGERRDHRSHLADAGANAAAGEAGTVRTEALVCGHCGVRGTQEGRYLVPLGPPRPHHVEEPLLGSGVGT